MLKKAMTKEAHTIEEKQGEKKNHRGESTTSKTRDSRNT